MPTPREDIYRWHSAAIRGERLPTHEWHPQCGWFLTRLAYRAPLVPGSIWLEQPICPETGELVADEVMHAEIMGEPWPVLDAWTWLSKRPICRLFYVQRLGELL